MKRRDFIKRTGQVAGASLLTGCINSHDFWDPLVDENTPAQISGLSLWLKAGAGITIATGVSNWADQSGNGNDASQGTPANQPIWVDNVINGRPALSFSSHLLTTTPITIGIFTIFCVFQSSATGPSLIYEHSADTNSNDGLYLWNTTTYTFLVSRNIVTTQSSKDLSLNWAADNIAKITTHRFDGTHANHTLHINGILQTLTDALTANPGTTTVTDNFYIGNRFAPPQPFGGYIAEIIVYNTALSDSERQTVENYLSVKYGISLTI